MSDNEKCGDYPAPCNCDDPTTHDGALDEDEEDLDESPTWLDIVEWTGLVLSIAVAVMGLVAILVAQGINIFHLIRLGNLW